MRQNISSWCYYREYVVNQLNDTREPTGTKLPDNYYEAARGVQYWLTPQAWPKNQEAIVSRQILWVRIVVFRWKKCFWQHPTSFVRSYNVQPQRITHMSGITKFHAVNQTVFVGRKPIGVSCNSKSRHCNSLSLSNKQVQRDCRYLLSSLTKLSAISTSPAATAII